MFCFSLWAIVHGVFSRCFSFPHLTRFSNPFKAIVHTDFRFLTCLWPENLTGGHPACSCPKKKVPKVCLHLAVIRVVVSKLTSITYLEANKPERSVGNYSHHYNLLACIVRICQSNMPIPTLCPFFLYPKEGERKKWVNTFKRGPRPRLFSPQKNVQP